MVQTKKVTDFQVALFGTRYWAGLIGWLADQALGEGYLAPADVDRLVVTDDIDEAVAIMVKSNIPGGAPGASAEQVADGQ